MKAAAVLLVVLCVLALALSGAQARNLNKKARVPKIHPSTPNPLNFTGYVVTGQWDGRTFPNVQWALDVTRQDTEWQAQQELKLQQLIPTTAGDALSPSFTAYDPVTRTYFMTTWRNHTSASIWGLVIADDVQSSKPLSPVETRYAFPAFDATLVGLEVMSVGGVLTPLAFFQNCTVSAINYATGATSLFATICNSSQQVTTAIDSNPASNEIYIVVQNAGGAEPGRQIAILNLGTAKTTFADIQPLANHNAPLQQCFEAVWMPSLNTMLVFYTGLFDQLLYIEPHSGMAQFAINNLAEYGDNGHFEFTDDPYLEMDDTFGNAATDLVNNRIYFQCTDVEPDSGEETTTLCQIPIPPKIEMLSYVNTAIWPLTYGYVGMQYVQVVKS